MPEGRAVYSQPNPEVMASGLSSETKPMKYYMVSLLLVAFWAFGMLASVTLDGYIDALLIAAIVVMLFGGFRSRPKHAGNG
jgi:hypothetical protein